MTDVVVGILGLLTIIAIVITLFKSKTQPAIAFIVWPTILALILIISGRITVNHFTVMLKSGFSSTAPTAALFLFNILLTLVVLFLLIWGDGFNLPTYFPFMIGCAIALFVNYGFSAKMHKKVISLHAGPALMMCATLMGAAVLLGTGLADVDIKDHIKNSFFYVWIFSILCMLFAVLIGIIPL